MKICLAALVASALGLGLAHGQPERPNFLVILVDDMGYSDLGCYGSEIPTPHLDALAENGIRYTRAYNTSKCFPTRAALLTGNWFQQTDREFPNTATIAEVLGPSGYRTGWSGKHHANFNPVTRGFDRFSGFLGGAVNFWNPGGEDPRTSEPVPGAVYSWAFGSDPEPIKPFIPDDPTWHCTDAFTDWAMDWLEDWNGETAGDRKRDPWFLYVAYNAPHWPLHAHPEDIEKFTSEGVYDAGYGKIREARYRRQIERGLFDPEIASLSPPDGGGQADWEALSEDEKEVAALKMSIHAAMVHHVDRSVGRLVAKLEALDQFKNTLILFLADNGASAENPKKPDTDPDAPLGTVRSFAGIGRSWANVCDTPLRKWKATSHEGGINTPLIAHWPEGISGDAAGAICREPVHLIDVVPTLIELAGEGAAHPGASAETEIPPLEGLSLTPTFADPADSLERETPLFFEWGSGNAVHEGNWKLVRSQGKAWELYDLATDRTETRNVAAEYGERVKEMGAAWEAWYERCAGAPYQGKRSRKRN